MNANHTKSQARERLGARRDADLARLIEITPQALYRYGEDDVLHANMQWRIEHLLLLRKNGEQA